MEPQEQPQAAAAPDGPRAPEVEKKYVNAVIVQTTYRLTEGAQSRDDTEHRINLKSFPCEVLSKTRYALQHLKLHSSFFYMPAQFYDMTKPDSFCLRNFLDANLCQTWYEQLPLTDIVCTCYSLKKSVGCSHFARGCELQCPRCH